MRFTEWVTLNGECISVNYDRMEPDPDRPGNLHLFTVKDAAHNRGERLVQLYRSEQLQKSVADACDFKIEHMMGINVIRRALDSGRLGFDAPFDELEYKELKVQKSDF